ncbi:MAG: hypothetical protein WC852_07420 [Candidatus Nanoarchaeia archaeon]|jgi:hypothetical protein
MAKIQLTPLMKTRLERLVKGSFISDAEMENFVELEGFVDHGRRGDNWEEWLASFQKTNDNYIPLLKKVLAGMKAMGEPYADGKYTEFMKEFGTMAPGVYSNPWDMTLTSLDVDPKLGNAEEVAAFYGL